MRPFKQTLGDLLEAQRGYLFPWSPVLYAIGIGGYFALRFEPTRIHWGGIGAAMVFLFLLAVVSRNWSRVAVIGGLLACAGFTVAGGKAHHVAEVTLDFRFYGAIEGRIVAVDRSVSDAVRLTLDQVLLEDVPLDRTPARVRVSLHGQQGFLDPEPGVTVILTGHLSPPGSAVEPGGYDFRRQAWFQGLGAVGYTRTPVLALESHNGNEPGLWLYRLRMALSQHVQAAMPGRAGAVAAALTTGDRSGIDKATYDALRRSNLAHLLAISGLHMGLLTGFIFAAVRVLLALLPRVALRVPVRKIAAVAALLVGVAYLLLSGGNVATERAFIMVGVMFCAVLLDRRAVTLRAVAVAAMIVLTLRPDALYGPGFQMSFAATTALVAVFGAFRDHGLSVARWPRWAQLIGGVALSSLVAGLATAPIGAAHFNQVPHYGLVANVLSVPLMGAVIIPGAVLAAILAPFGLDWIGFAVMTPAIEWILAVADEVSSWSGAVSKVIAPGSAVLPVLALGTLWMVLWQGRGRWAGVPVALLAFVLWAGAERPALLVSQSGGLIGLLGENGRALSKARGEGFAAEIWLENDGDHAPQAEAAERPGFSVAGRSRTLTLGDRTILHATGKRAAATALAECGKVALVILNVPVEPQDDGCLVFDRRALEKSGALAIRQNGQGLHITSVRDVAGIRLWSR